MANLPKNIGVVFLTIVLLIFVYLSLTREMDSTQPEETAPKQTDSLTISDSLWNLLYDLRVEHPEVVYVQALEESNHFTSVIFKENHNCFGMQIPFNRATTALRINRGHSVYKSLRECVIDYALYQMAYRKGLTREEYIKRLGGYAENPNYVNNINQLLKQKGL